MTSVVPISRPPYAGVPPPVHWRRPRGAAPGPRSRVTVDISMVVSVAGKYPMTGGTLRYGSRRVTGWPRDGSGQRLPIEVRHEPPLHYVIKDVVVDRLECL